jgi:hypothetical protein
MLLLTFGFFLIVIGDTVLGDFLNINDKNTVKIIEAIAEISGFLLVIVADRLLLISSLIIDSCALKCKYVIVNFISR